MTNTTFLDESVKYPQNRIVLLNGTQFSRLADSPPALTFFTAQPDELGSGRDLHAADAELRLLRPRTGREESPSALRM